jgi:uracil-DNA glycosylase family 4
MGQGERVEGQGPSDAKIVIVGEAPGADEEESGVPFCGPSGRMLNDWLLEAGIRRSECYVTNVVKWRPPNNNLRKLSEIGHSIEEGIPQLWQEIGAINPNVILALGNLSLNVLTGKGNGFTGIMHYRGSVLPSLNLDSKVIPTIHPAAFLHSENAEGAGAMKYQMRHVVRFDLKRLKEQSLFKRYSPPERNLEIIKSPIALQRFLDLYADKHIVSVDIETVYGLPVCIALAFNEWHAASVPLLDILSWQNLEGIADHQLCQIWKILAELFGREDILVIGQNFKFDHGKLEDVCGIKIRNVYCDVMLLAHSLHCEFEKSQAFLASIYTEEPYYKDEGREFNWKKDKVDRLLLYNAKDAAVAFEIFLRLTEAARELVVPGFPNWLDDFFFGYVMKLHYLYKDLEEVGILADDNRRKELILEYEDKIKYAQLDLDDIVGHPVNVSSPKQVSELLYKEFKLPIRKGVDEDTLVALEANSCKLPSHKRALELIIHIRRLRKSKGTYFEAKPDYDGRMRTSVRICGTETGRSSNSILKQPLRPEKIGLAFQTMTKHGEIGAELRSYFIADPGYSFVEIDLSQAEARIVALLGRDEKTLKLFDDKVDIHRLTSTWIFGVAFEKVTPEFRFIGKTTRHAGNYDMGKKRLMQIVNTDAKKFGINISISEWQGGKILEKFHQFNPPIRQVFHKEIRDAIDKNDRVLVSPFGRYRKFFGRWGDELYREAYAHIPQSTVPDHLRQAGLRALPRFWADKVLPRFIGGKTPFVVEAHDAFVGLVPNDYVERYVQIMTEELNKPIDFANCTLSRGKLIIPSEAKVGRNYKECKVKGCRGCDGMHDYLPVAA